MHPIDAWISAMPDNPYDPCPCGCGLKFRYVQRDPLALAEHEARFIANLEKKEPPCRQLEELSTETNSTNGSPTTA